MSNAGPADAGVLQEDRTAVAERARGQHRGSERAAQPAPAGRDQQDRGGQAETDHGEPPRRQPLQGQLGQRHGGAPQQPGRNEGCHGVTAVDVHTPIIAFRHTAFVASGL